MEEKGFVRSRRYCEVAVAKMASAQIAQPQRLARGH